MLYKMRNALLLFLFVHTAGMHFQVHIESPCWFLVGEYAIPQPVWKNSCNPNITGTDSLHRIAHHISVSHALEEVQLSLLGTSSIQAEMVSTLRLAYYGESSSLSVLLHKVLKYFVRSLNLSAGEDSLSRSVCP
mmetsp:Transcript_20106/g.66920  ORF Transcript_20106/g.66920 Transcript_20106/m.66920 type:complete len:134 (+) Transcript_20106:5160-5561(+)